MAAPLPPLQPSRRKSILVIDDERRLAESLASLLRGCGYQVTASHTGPDGLRLLSERAFDLVITDLRMAEVDGFDIVRHVADHCPDTGLIIMTGHASTETAIEALHQRVADYIPKPFDFEFLKGSIEKVFARQEADRLRRDLAHMLTHDIKVPLTSVLGYAQMIFTEGETLRSGARQSVDAIIANTQRILAMLDNYLTNARVEEGRLEIFRTPVDVAELTSELADLLGYDFRRRDLQVIKDWGNYMGPVEADEHLLGRAISNLLSNAAKYSHPGTDVHLRLHEHSGILHFSVVNQGDGLTEAEAASVFDRYQRAGSARGIEGSGLGLHVVRSVMEAHGGRAVCETTGGRVEFRLELPRVLPSVRG